MRNKDDIDNMIKSAINDSILDIKPSRDIFNEAWDNKEVQISKKIFFNIRSIKKVVIVPVCCIVLAICGVFSFFPGARVAAQEALKTIFLADKSGNIIEKSEDTEVWLCIGPLLITEKNKMNIERRFGFTVNLPDKIGEYTYKSNDSFASAPGIVISAAVKYKDEDKIRDKLEKALVNDKDFDELKKNYNLDNFINSAYVDNQGHKFRLTLLKDGGEPLKSSEYNVRKVNIDDIECTILKDTQYIYGSKMNTDGSWGTDLEHKPANNGEYYEMFWKYNGIMYQLAIGKNSSDIDSAIEFATDYIKILKDK